jgi:Uma2 family endonuclease
MATVVRHRFTVEDYERMGRAGILREDDRVELIDGEIVDMPPIGSGHAGCVKWLANALARSVGGSAIVAVQDPLRLGEHSQPQPDVLLLRWRDDHYRRAHPMAGDVLLLVEVAESSAAYDRQVKVPLYARHGVTEVWLVDLEAGTVEVYRRPQGDGYGEVRVLGRGERVSPSAFPALELAVDDILGPEG